MNTPHYLGTAAVEEVWEQRAEENIWSYERGIKTEWGKLNHEDLVQFALYYYGYSRIRLTGHVAGMLEQ
jgi:hypothetical protein